MKPCDCKSMEDVNGKLNEAALFYNGWSITVSPNYVRIDSQICRLRMPMTILKRFSEWYLEDQEKSNNGT
jgi:hypothetical protein